MDAIRASMRPGKQSKCDMHDGLHMTQYGGCTGCNLVCRAVRLQFK